MAEQYKLVHVSARTSLWPTVPGSSWNYSNIGYATLGFLIRKVTGKYYGDFLQERIFKPLGMATARVISEADIVPNRAAGYRLVRGELKNQEWVSPATNSTADGSLYFSILDLAKWDAALYSDSPLSLSSREKIWTPANLTTVPARITVLVGTSPAFMVAAWCSTAARGRVLRHSSFAFLIRS